jgi:hypothetical protein
MSDDADIKALIAGLEAIDAGAIDAVSAQAAQPILFLIDNEFVTGTDPYGNAWNAPNNLLDTGAMISTLTVSNNLEISIGGPADYHQSGTSRMPARKILPNSDEELPLSWLQALADATDKVIGSKINQTSEGEENG